MKVRSTHPQFRGTHLSGSNPAVRRFVITAFVVILGFWVPLLCMLALGVPK
jgi:hypothetical protein